MIDWKKINWNKLKECLHRKENVFKKKKGSIVYSYSNLVFTFDCETTTYFFNSETLTVEAFSAYKDADYYKKLLKLSELYIWQVGIEKEVYYGRTIKELKDFLWRLNGVAGEVIPIFYIHNLSFDINYIFDAIGAEYFDIFCRESQKPIKAYNSMLGIEFRCSLMLTNCSLDELAKSRKLEAQKQVGLLDYNQIRTPYTMLTEDELKYCEYDIKVLYEVIKEEKQIYKSIYNIPLTSTGKVRQHIKGIFYKDEDHKRFIHNIQPTQLTEYKLLEKVYAGGYTHSNFTHTNIVLHNILSMDITSSYPFIACTTKLPMQNFRKSGKKWQNIDTDLYAYIIDVTLYELKPKNTNSFLSASKKRVLDDKGNKVLSVGIVNDNGRIRECKNIKKETGTEIKGQVRFCLTDDDWKTVLNNYSFKYKVHNVYIATKEYLDIRLIEYILDLFKKKSQYKGLDDFVTEYRIAKESINSIYGLFVTKFLIDPVEFKNGKYITGEGSDEYLQELINKHNEQKNDMLWAWGVFIASAARRHLWEMIETIGDDVVYCDTDSIKFLNWEKYVKIDENGEYHFEEDDKRVNAKIEAVCKHYNIPVESFTAVTPKGKISRLGHFSFDGLYEDFKTLGAKKYCYKEDGKIHITVAGLSKKAAKYIEKVEDFKVGLFFDCEKSGRTVAYYNDNQPIGIQFNDGWKSKCKYGVAIMPTSYLLGITGDYDILIKNAKVLDIY